MKYEEITPSFVQLEGVKTKVIDYSILDTKYTHEYTIHNKYKLGQHYKITDEKSLTIVNVIIECIFDELKNSTTDPTKKLVIENHRSVILTLLKNLYDSEISVDSRNLLTILDGVIYANTKQFYKKEH